MPREHLSLTVIKLNTVPSEHAFKDTIIVFVPNNRDKNIYFLNLITSVDIWIESVVCVTSFTTF